MDHLVGLFDPTEDDTNLMPECLPPEVESGNIEYKLQLLNPSESRFEHLVTQMKWRLQEGEGEAIYEIGVTDGGTLAGLKEEDLRSSLNTLDRMAKRLDAAISILRERQVDTPAGEPCKKVAEVLVRRVPENQQFIDLRLAVLGNVDAGKSTLLGVLTQGELDNGRGRARLNLFRHLHEIQSGRTSSISHEILGFNDKGEVVNYSESRTAEEICENSTKLITLIDLCGHHKYLKTTIFGLTGYSPDFAMLVVSANTGIVGTTKEHLGFALALGVPIFVVISKVDMCPASQVEKTVKQMEKILKSPGCKKVPMRIECDDDAVTAASNFHTESICPVFTLSSVSGLHLNLLKTFLNVLPPLQSSNEREKYMQELSEFQVDEVYSIPSVGVVAAGNVLRGTIKEGDCLMLGPTEDGEFHPTRIGSIHRNRLPCRVTMAGQTVSLALGGPHAAPIGPVRKGMVLVSPELHPNACVEFEADIYILFHSGYICTGFQTVIHVGNVRQTATIVKISKVKERSSDAKRKKNCIHTNEKAVVTFRFITRPEYVRVGSRLLLREGRTKGMGEVTKIFPIEADR